MASSISFANITPFVDELSSPLITNTILAAKTFDLIDIQEGVKNTTILKTLTGVPVFQAIGDCVDLTPAAGPAFGQRLITVCPIQVVECLGLSKLEQYWPGYYMHANGSYNTEVPSEVLTTYLENKANEMSKETEKLYWQGDTTLVGSTNNLNKCDGLIKLLNADASVIDYGAGSGTKALMTAGKVIANINGMIAAMPASQAGQEMVLFLSPENFQTAINAYFALNNFHFDVKAASMDGFFNVPTAWNVKVYRIAGLQGNFQAVLSRPKNLVVGTDRKDELSTRYKMWFEDNKDSVMYQAKFKIGAQVHFPGEVVLFTGVEL